MSVYDEIMAERAAQAAKGRDAAHDDKRTQFDWIECLGRVVHKPGISAREMWVKVASVAVAAVESIDRKAAREAGGGR